MALHLTQAAAERIVKFLQKDSESVGFRVNVVKTGCSGWGYEVEIAHQISDDEVVFQDKGVDLIVSQEALELIDGTEIDFEQQGINHVFVSHNPKATGECGCGESFTVN